MPSELLIDSKRVRCYSACVIHSSHVSKFVHRMWTFLNPLPKNRFQIKFYLLILFKQSNLKLKTTSFSLSLFSANNNFATSQTPATTVTKFSLLINDHTTVQILILASHWHEQFFFCLIRTHDASFTLVAEILYLVLWISASQSSRSSLDVIIVCNKNGRKGNRQVRDFDATIDRGYSQKPVLIFVFYFFIFFWLAPNQNWLTFVIE